MEEAQALENNHIQGRFGSGVLVGAAAGPWASVPMVRQVRGHVIIATVELLRLSNDFDRYRGGLQSRGAGEVLDAGPNDWIPLRLMTQHMYAISDLRRTPASLLTLGCELGKRAYGTLLSTLMRLASHLGATPWTALRQASKVWQRMYDGGALVAYQEAPCVARLEWWRNPLSAMPGYGEITAGAAQYGLALFAGGPVRVELLGSADNGTSLGARFSLPSRVRRDWNVQA